MNNPPVKEKEIVKLFVSPEKRAKSAHSTAANAGHIFLFLHQTTDRQEGRQQVFSFAWIGFLQKISSFTKALPKAVCFENDFFSEWRPGEWEKGLVLFWLSLKKCKDVCFFIHLTLLDYTFFVQPEKNVHWLLGV